MNPILDRFMSTTRDYLFGDRARAGAKEVNEMRAMDERMKEGMARRMRDVVANPPQRTFARELLSRGMTANEVWQLVMHDPAFVRVPEAFRIAVANAAREMAAEPVSHPARRTPVPARRAL